MRPEGRPDVAEPRPRRRSCLANSDGVKLALKIAAPEFQKTAQLGEIRGNVELLPDEALQQVWMIRHMIDDLRGRQSVIARRLPVLIHLHALVRFARSKRPACPIDRSPTINKVEQMISSLLPGLLPGGAEASLEATTRGVR